MPTFMILLKTFVVATGVATFNEQSVPDTVDSRIACETYISHMVGKMMVSYSEPEGRIETTATCVARWGA